MNEMTTKGRGIAGRRVLAIAVLIGSSMMAACEDDPVDANGHDEGDVASFRIRQVGGGTLFTYSAPPADPDTMVLQAGTSTAIEIEWLDEDGDIVEVDADEHSWQLADNHSAITSFTLSTTDPWRGTIVTTGLVPGNTVYGGFTVTLFHGDEPEFQTSQQVAAVES